LSFVFWAKKIESRIVKGAEPILYFLFPKDAIFSFDDPERVPSPRIRVAEGKIAMPSFLDEKKPKKTASHGFFFFGKNPLGKRRQMQKPN
jgi:hypothetical protein